MSRQDPSSREVRFEALYRATAKDLLAFLTRRASDAEGATEILAEVYIIAWRRLDKVPPGDGARLWLFGVARNLLIKSNKRHHSHQALVHDLTIELTRLPVYQSETTDDGLNDMMRASLQNLPAKQREVLLLTAWEELKPREIAKVTGSTANVVRVRLHHARQRVARELRPTGPRSAERDEPTSGPLSNAPTVQ
jgi:RNA polymerase sigma-70 factor (ECF subfamily)